MRIKGLRAYWIERVVCQKKVQFLEEKMKSQSYVPWLHMSEVA
jgi:hypothetical protein